MKSKPYLVQREKQGGVCWLCGGCLPLPKRGKRRSEWGVERHHIVHVCRGGTKNGDNIRLVHTGCHKRYHKNLNRLMDTGKIINANVGRAIVRKPPHTFEPRPTAARMTY